MKSILMKVLWKPTSYEHFQYGIISFVFFLLLLNAPLVIADIKKAPVPEILAWLAGMGVIVCICLAYRRSLKQAIRTFHEAPEQGVNRPRFDARSIYTAIIVALIILISVVFLALYTILLWLATEYLLFFPLLFIFHFLIIRGLIRKHRILLQEQSALLRDKIKKFKVFSLKALAGLFISLLSGLLSSLILVRIIKILFFS